MGTAEQGEQVNGVAMGLPPEKGVMLWEKPEEKETRATGYTVQERYRSRWLSPISRYSHLCAGNS